MEKTRISIYNLQKTFFTLRGSVTALDDINLTIEPGELYVLLGASGCGKSTLLNLIAGLEKPSRGKIYFNETLVSSSEEKIHLTPFKRDVSMVFQSYALYPHMSVSQNIAFPLTNLKPKPSKEEIQKKVYQTASTLRIENLLDRKPKELSGGQRQRAAIGRAIIRNPAVFLMDEPLSNLDAQLRQEMRTLIKSLQQKLGITTVYVTHDQLEALTLGDRVAVLNNGLIQQMGEPMEVYNFPNDKFIAEFIGSPPMNIFKGKIKQKENQNVFQSVEFTIPLDHPLADKLKQREDKEFYLGIRPEHIIILPPGKGSIDVSIDLIENLGSENLVYIMKSKETLIIKTTETFDQNKISLNFPMENLHFFNNAGKRIPLLD